MTASSGLLSQVLNCMNVEDARSLLAFVHSNDLNPFGVLLATASHQDSGFQMHENVTVE